LFSLLIRDPLNNRGGPAGPSIIGLKDSSNILYICEKLYDFYKSTISIRDRCLDYIYKINKNDYFQPETIDINLSYTYDDVLEYILNLNITDKFITNNIPSNTVLATCGSTCIIWDKFNHTIFSMIKLPKSIQDYCYAIIATDKLTDDMLKDEINDWLKQFDLLTAFEQERKLKITLISQINNKLNKIDIIPYSSPRYTKEQEINSMYDLLNIKISINSISNWISSLLCAISNTNTIILMKESISFKDKYLNISHIYANKINLLKNNFKNKRAVTTSVYNLYKFITSN
jgi:hypothetical protein